jgi:hypothetical protein
MHSQVTSTPIQPTGNALVPNQPTMDISNFIGEHATCFNNEGKHRTFLLNAIYIWSKANGYAKQSDSVSKFRRGYGKKLVDFYNPEKPTLAGIKDYGGNKAFSTKHVGSDYRTSSEPILFAFLRYLSDDLAIMHEDTISKIHEQNRLAVQGKAMRMSLHRSQAAIMSRLAGSMLMGVGELTGLIGSELPSRDSGFASLKEVQSGSQAGMLALEYTSDAMDERE